VALLIPSVSSRVTLLFLRLLPTGLCGRLEFVEFGPEFFLGFLVHPVNEQNAVQVIHFVLHRARE
jgi:hypothetical protein